MEGPPGGSALEFLTEHSSLLGLPERTRPSLREMRVMSFQDMQYVRFQQEVAGTAISGAEVVVALGPRGEIVQLASDYLPDPRPDGDWIISAAEALRTAQRSKPMTARGEVQFDRLWRGNEQGRLTPIWRVRVPAKEPFGDWEFDVDARNGDVLAVDNLVRGAGEGLAYLTNPVRGGPTPQRVRLENLLTPGSLSGRFGKVYSGFPAWLGLVPPVVTLAEPDRNGDFFFSLFDPRFAEVQLYHNIDRVHGRFQAIGFRSLDRPVEGVAWDLAAFLIGPYHSPFEFQGRGGIFFAPMLPRLLDPTWDADAIYHEYTHAVVNSIVGPSQGKVFGALNEAYADYFAGSFLGDPDIGEFAGPIFGSRFLYLRTMRNGNLFPRDLFDEIHQTSLIWSGALWDVRSALGPERADVIALGGLLSLSGNADFFIAGLATIQAAEVLFGRAVRDQVFAVMRQRGITSLEGLSAFLARDLTPNVGAANQIEAAGPNACVLGDLDQFRINVPPGATSLNFALASTANLRLYVRFRRPVTIASGSAEAEYSTEYGREVGGSVTAASFPELQSGTYYLAVASCNQFPVGYAVAANHSSGGSALTTVLSPGVSAPGSIPTGPFLNSRQFAIQVPTGATSLTVAVQGSVDVDLYIGSNRRVRLGEQGLPVADAHAETASFSETISLTRLTLPDLRSGLYYIAVYNFDDRAPARFSVTATIATAQPEQTTVVPVTSGSTVQASVPGASGGLGVLSPRQYSFQVPSNAAKVTVVASTSLDVNIFLRRNAPVAIQNGRAVAEYFFSPGPYQSRLEITPASSPPLQAGTYHIAIRNFSPSPGTVSLTVTVESGAATGPTIAAQNGVVNGASFQPGLASGAWISILGTNLATTTRIWRDSDFIGNRLPTQLDGVRVNINGSPAYVYYISPTQINVLAPGDPAEGSVQVEVLTPQGRSAPVIVQKQRFAPTFFMLDPEGRRYVAAVHVDGTLLGRTNLFGGAVATRPARPGDVILLFGTGFGPTDPPAPEGEIVRQVGRLRNPVTVRIGNTVAEAAFAGIVGAGLYQFNVTVPGLPAGDHPVIAEIGGFRSQANAFITVGAQF